MFQTRTEQTVVPLLLTAREAAKVLALSERTLFSLTKCGAIPVVKIGDRGIRYDPADLRSWIDSAKESQKGS